MEHSDTQTEQKNDFPSIELELLSLLSKQGRLAPIPILFTSGIIVSFVIDDYSPWIWGSWFALIVCGLTVRGIVLHLLPKLEQYTERFRLNVAITLSTINGCTHGLSLFFFQDLTSPERVTQSLILLGLNSITVITTAGYLPISLAYMLPTLVPISILWATVPIGEEITTLEISLAAMHFIFCPVFIKVAWETFKRFRESVEIRKEQVILNRKLEEALKEAERANTAKTRFLAAASHDLRQPIHTLSLFGAALSMRPLDEKSYEIASHMDIAVQRLASQFDALLDISKLDAGIVPIHKKNFSLTELLNRLREEYEQIATEKDLSLEINNLQDLQVYTDPALLERILSNLISNAIKYTDLGYVNINFYAHGDECLINIKDSGLGIPEEEQEKIFEEYYQLGNPERDHQQGLGLGLAIVQRLCALLNIHFSLRSEVGAGSEFILALPRSQENTSTTDISEHTSIAGLKILVIDDERGILAGMENLLLELGCSVKTGQTTSDAIRITTEFEIDIALVDFRLLDNENGIKTIEAIHKIQPGLPALLISGDTAPERLSEAKQAGIKLLHKPVAVEELTKNIAEACFN